MKKLLVIIICCLSFMFVRTVFAGPAPTKPHKGHQVIKTHQHKKVKVQTQKSHYKPIQTPTTNKQVW
jgi:hypothetical protein